MAIVGENSGHGIKLSLCEVFTRIFLRAFPEMHDLSDPCPSERLLDGAVFDCVILDDSIVHDVLPSEEGCVLAALLVRLVDLRLDVVVDIPKDVVGALADQHFHHFGVADLHGDLQRRSIAVRWIWRALHDVEHVLQDLYFTRVDG
jgi:hypothetical protein